MFCYALALSPTPPALPGEERVSLAERASHVLPFARPLRQLIRRRPRLINVDPSLLLVGAQGGYDAVAFAEARGMLGLGSMPMEDSPHVQLLRAAVESKSDLTDDEIRASAYWAFAHWVASVDGAWFGAHTDEEFLEVTRNFIDWALQRSPRYTDAAGSPFEDQILVATISGSPMYQLIDGHHRVAVAVVRGDTTLRVRRTWLSSETPLQHRLHELNSSRRARVMVQPVPARDVETGWLVTSDCKDRLLRMVRFVESDAHKGNGVRTYLDVGAGYGWFLGEMKRFGYSVEGIVADPGARSIGTSFFELTDDELVVGDLAECVERLSRSFDVVSSFELLRVFAGGSGRDEAEHLIKAIDRVADRVLFVDTDERPDLAAGSTKLSASSLTRLIIDTTSFREVVDLGDNHDPVGPWSSSQKSRLIALVR